MSFFISIILIMHGTGRHYGLRKIFPVGFPKYLKNGNKHETYFYKCGF